MDDDDIRDLFAAFGPVRIRKMFGGRGIYSGDMIFALEAFGSLWIKADDQSRALFDAEGSKPFTYEAKNGKHAVMSYWSLPDSALDDPDEVKRWARLGLAAALRAKKK